MKISGGTDFTFALIMFWLHFFHLWFALGSLLPPNRLRTLRGLFQSCYDSLVKASVDSRWYKDCGCDQLQWSLSWRSPSQNSVLFSSLGNACYCSFPLAFNLHLDGKIKFSEKSETSSNRSFVKCYTQPHITGQMF